MPSVFQNYRNCFGTKCKAATRPLREINAQGLFVARTLRVHPIG